MANPFGAAASPFGAAGQANPFGSPATPGTTAFGAAASPFGQSGGSIFGSGGTPAFGATPSQPAFGASSSPVFGGSTPAFGSTASPFGASGGTSLFGQQQQQQQKPAFGGFGSTPGAAANPFGAFGQTASAFGTPNSTPAFGASSTPSAFGSTTPSLFGSSSAFGTTGATPAFGAASTPAFGGGSTPAFGGGGGLFGSTQQQSAPAFGLGQTGSAFGGLGTTSAFGASAPAFGTSAFGTPGGAFGAASGGSRNPAYRATPDTESATTAGGAVGNFISISAMPQYKEKSVEELRWEDYQRGDKGGPAQPTSVFGQAQPAASPFGTSSSPFGATTTSPFGTPGAGQTGGLFGSTPSSTPAFGLGGSSTPTFGSTTPAFGSTTPSLFGTPSGTSTPAFGASTTPAFGTGTSVFGAGSTPTFGAGGTSPFGATAGTSPFGSAASTPSLFGGSSTPAFGGGGFGAGSGLTSGGFGQTSGAGTSLFGTPGQTSGAGLFGAAPGASSSGFGFGLGTAGTTGFGGAQSAPSMFGGATAGTAGGGGLFGGMGTSSSLFPGSFQTQAAGLAQGTSAFGGFGAAAKPASGFGFGFGASSAGATSSLFGGTTSPFGGTAPSFGMQQPSTASSGLFSSLQTVQPQGQQQQQQQQMLMLQQQQQQNLQQQQQQQQLQQLAMAGIPLQTPFGTLPPLPQFLAGTGTAGGLGGGGGGLGLGGSTELGIASMPVAERRASRQRISSLLLGAGRAAGGQRGSMARARVTRAARPFHPAPPAFPAGTSAKVPFFYDDDLSSVPQADAFFLPRDNPRKLFIRDPASLTTNVQRSSLRAAAKAAAAAEGRAAAAAAAAAVADEGQDATGTSFTFHPSPSAPPFPGEDGGGGGVSSRGPLLGSPSSPPSVAGDTRNGRGAESPVSKGGVSGVAGTSASAGQGKGGAGTGTGNVAGAASASAATAAAANGRAAANGSAVNGSAANGSLSLAGISPDVASVLPRLSTPDYFTEPSLAELAAAEAARPGYCSRVKDFVVGRTGVGQVKFLGETDVRRLALDEIVLLNEREVVVYPEEEGKPPEGTELNKPAEVTLLKIHCLNKATGERVLAGEAVERYMRRLKAKTEQQGAEFVSFDPARGEWVFRVEHFSRYGLDLDEDDDDDEEEANGARGGPAGGIDGGGNGSRSGGGAGGAGAATVAGGGGGSRGLRGAGGVGPGLQDGAWAVGPDDPIDAPAVGAFAGGEAGRSVRLDTDTRMASTPAGLAGVYGRERGLGLISKTSTLSGLHADYAAQLLAAGQCHWALYVLQHAATAAASAATSSAAAASRAATVAAKGQLEGEAGAQEASGKLLDQRMLERGVRDVLTQFCPIWMRSEEQQQFMRQQLAVPSVWMEAAKAIFWRYQGNAGEELQCLLGCEAWDEAHQLLMNDVAPSQLLAGSTHSVLSVVRVLVPHKSVVAHWTEGGGLLLDLDFLRGALDDAADDYSLEEDVEEGEKRLSDIRRSFEDVSRRTALSLQRFPKHAKELRAVYGEVMATLSQQLINITTRNRWSSPDSVLVTYSSTMTASTVPAGVRLQQVHGATSAFLSWLGSATAES